MAAGVNNSVEVERANRKQPYVLDPQWNVWRRSSDLGLAAAPQAPEIEKIVEVIRQARDIACGSPELMSQVRDWPTLYHLSPERSNVLRPVRDILRGRILEIGAECGAITRFLGETRCEVVALEPNSQKARAAASRCAGLSNVSIICDSLPRAGLEGTFDCVTLIGTLEHAPETTEGANAVKQWLQRCASLLADDGTLLIAVDNRLALKYFAGAPEDHTGGIFHGIAGLYGARDGKAFSRREIDQQLEKAGFQQREFFYPVPDYRLSRALLHPRLFQADDGKLVTDLVQRFSAFYDPRWNYERLFSERLAWATILRSGLGEEFAPSFFVLASKHARPAFEGDFLAYTATTLRRRCFQKANVLTRRRGRFVFRRHKLYEELPFEEGFSRQQLSDEPYFKGRLWANELYDRLDKPGWTFDTIQDWFQPYLEFLMHHSELRDGQRLLPPNFLDCTPFNLVRRPDGRFEAFDLEWIAREPVPLDLLLFRSLFYTIAGTISVAAPRVPSDLRVLSIVLQLIEGAGLKVTPQRLEQLFALEEIQQKCAAGDHATLDRNHWENTRLSPRIADVRAELTRRDGAIHELTSRLQERETQAAAVQRQLEDRELQIGRLGQETAKRDARLEEIFQQAARNEARAVAGEAQLSELRGEFARTEERARTDEAQLATLRIELARTEQRALAGETQLAGLRAELSSLTQTMAVLASTLGRRDEDLERERGRVEKLRGSLQQRDSQIRETTSQLSSARAEIDQLSTTLVERQERIATFERDHATSVARIRELDARLSDIDSTLASTQRELSRWKNEAVRLTTELQGRDSRIAELSAQLQGLQTESTDLRQSLRDRDRRVGQLAGALTAEGIHRARFERATGQLGQLSREADRRAISLFAAVERAQAAFPERDASIERLDRARARATHDLEATRASWSWRLTKPLRLLVDFAAAIPKLAACPVTRLRLAWLCRRPEFAHALQAVRNTGLFDSGYYTSRYPEVARHWLPPLAHYIVWGAAEARSPHPLFSPAYYRQHYEAAGGDHNDLVRWIEQGAAQAQIPHPLFDTAYYLRNNPAAAASGVNPLTHFLQTGGREGFDPHPLFDCSYYLDRNPDVARSGMNPLVHYLVAGHQEGRDPHPFFDSRYYASHDKRIEQGAISPLEHYLLEGAAAGFSPHPLFDGDYYLGRYPDVAAAGVNPLAHYLEWGARTGRNPNALFDAQYYQSQVSPTPAPDFHPLAHYLEIGAKLGLNPHPLFDSAHYRRECTNVNFGQITPLEHYLRNGRAETASPHPLFDALFYLEHNPDAATARLIPLVHYLKYGAKEGRLPNPWFDPAWYLAQYPDVARAGMDPLVHYLLWGAKENKDPGPRFATAAYLAANPDVAEGGANPLIHYLTYGFYEGREPRPAVTMPGVSPSEAMPADAAAQIEAIRPYFDIEFYGAQCPELAHADVDLLEHYLVHGAKQGKDPHALFDSSFYLEMNPDVAAGGSNPLVHFALYGGKEGRDPHPLFRCAYYLEKYRDVRKSGLNPLLHYLQQGAVEGRCPNPLFDGSFYYHSNPDVAAARANPLIHFIQNGAVEGRNPHPAFDVRFYVEQHPEVTRSGVNPLVHYFGPSKPRPAHEPAPAVVSHRPEKRDRFKVEALAPSTRPPQTLRPARTILCVSHVPPYPPRAGNEYLEYRQFDYFARHGYRIILALSPLPGEEISSRQLHDICDRFPYTVLCGRDGLIQHKWPDGEALLGKINGRRIRPLAPDTDEEALSADPRESSLIGHERVFCHDPLARLVLYLESNLAPCVVLSQYIFQTRFLPLIRSKSLKLVQTIDMFSSKQDKVVQFGVEDSLNMAPEQERRRLLRADVILACQHAEAQAFTALAPERPVLEVPLDFDVVDDAPPPRGSKLLYVASDNGPSTKGFRDFLRVAWPLVLREAPHAELLVAGRVCRTVERAPENVRLLGQVADLTPLYEEAKLTINPSVAGTGFKIKTAESLSHLRPVVGWPSSVDGFQSELAALCYSSTDWRDFAGRVVEILNSPRQQWFSAEDVAQIRNSLSPDAVYADLLNYLNDYCDRLHLQEYRPRASLPEHGA